MPPREVSEALIGSRGLPPTVGMFGIAGVGRMVQRAEDVSFDFFKGQSAGSMGIVSSVHGLPTLLSVCLDAPEQGLRAQGMVPVLIAEGGSVNRLQSRVLRVPY